MQGSKTQGTTIEPILLTQQNVEQAAAIDGAILIDVDGYCHGIGVILDGEVRVRGNPARGARFNTALRYANAQNEGRLVVVVSEDGHVDLFPRLRTPILRSELDSILREIRSHPDGQSVPSKLEAAAVRIVREYRDYVEENSDWNKIVETARFGMLELILDDHATLVGQFDKHSSDFIKE